MKDWSYYVFSVDNDYYIFETFSCSLKKISLALYQKLKSNDIESRKIIRKLKDFFPNNYDNYPNNKDETCFIGLNFANDCNLNCSYCFRDKKIYHNCNDLDFNRVIEFSKKFMPNANEYVFSVGYTTEVSFHISIIKQLDNIIANHEGHLFSRESFISSPEDFYLKLPKQLKNKYLISKDNVISVLNSILKNEKLENYFSYKNILYAKKILDKNTNLSIARRVIVNRHILTKKYSKFLKEPKTKPMSISFMTNGTNISSEFISLIKQEGVQNIYVSIDGDEIIHNYSRKYKNGNGTYQDVVNGIMKLKEEHISIIASVVLTNKYPNIKYIVEHLEKLGVDGIDFCFARGKQNFYSYKKENIKEFFLYFDSLLNEILEQILYDNFSLLNLLKNNYFFRCLNSLITKNFCDYRCSFENTIVINPNGDLYHCNYTMGLDEDYRGNIVEGILFNHKDFFVDSNSKCRECWAKYLCGGICYYENLINNDDFILSECYSRKEYIKRALIFYIKIIKMDKVEAVKNILS